MSAAVEEREYVVLAAKRRSYCPYCPDTIEVNDPVTRRANDLRFCHHRCALAEDELEQQLEDAAGDTDDRATRSERLAAIRRRVRDERPTYEVVVEATRPLSGVRKR